ncbi:CHC2 zinc finger domain-containing protein [Candidatus Vidania fulgoroideorum]
MSIKNLCIYIENKKTKISNLNLKETYNKNKIFSFCPFHKENRESLLLNIDKRFYYCFGCKKSGKIYNFKKKNNIYSFSKYIFFSKKLLSNYNAINFLYNKRIFNVFAIYEFKIGFLKNYIDFSFFFNKVFYKKLYYILKDKVFFPVLNSNGKVLSLVIRNLNKKKFSKYIFFPLKKGIKKKNVLYGIFQNKYNIITKKYVFIVEGCTDLISMYINKVDNVVSTLGSNLDINYFRILSKLCNIFIILYDNDKAGKESILRFYLKNESYIRKKNIFVLELNDKDPNEFFILNKKVDFYKIIIRKLITIEKFIFLYKKINKFDNYISNINYNPLKLYKKKTGCLFLYRIKKILFNLISKLSKNKVLIKDYKLVYNTIVFLNSINEKI